MRGSSMPRRLPGRHGISTKFPCAAEYVPNLTAWNMWWFTSCHSYYVIGKPEIFKWSIVAFYTCAQRGWRNTFADLFGMVFLEASSYFSPGPSKGAEVKTLLLHTFHYFTLSFGNQTWLAGNPLWMKVFIGKSAMNGPLSSKPCLITGGYIWLVYTKRY